MTSDATGRCPAGAAFRPLEQDFKRDPYRVVSQLQRDAPVFHHPELDIWVASRYEDVERIQTGAAVFSQQAAMLAPPPDGLEVDGHFFDWALMNSDPPRHTVSRRLMNRAFTPRRVAGLEPQIRETSRDLIEGLSSATICDLVNEFCYPFTVTIITNMLGLGPEGRQRFVQCAEDLMVLVTPRTPSAENASQSRFPEGVLAERWLRLDAIRAELADVVAERALEPGDDLVSAIVESAGDNDTESEIPHVQIATHIIELIAAGTDTTANLIAHMVQLFTDHPDQLELVRDDPSLWKNAIEEGLRRRGTALGVFRRTTEEVTLSDVTIPADALVWSLVGGAGHDEIRFPSPEVFDVTRGNAAQHISFGKGPHFCLGAPLARLATRIALEELYAHLPRLRVVDDPPVTYKPVLKNFVIDRMHVRWD